jgi:hypothetical protein
MRLASRGGTVALLAHNLPVMRRWAAPVGSQGPVLGFGSVPPRVAAVFDKTSRLAVWLPRSRTSVRSAGWRSALKGGPCRTPVPA